MKKKLSFIALILIAMLTLMAVGCDNIEQPTGAPTQAPVEGPTQAPIQAPTSIPTEAPTEILSENMQYKVIVRNEEGNPVPDILIMICQENICFNPVKTDENGEYTVTLEKNGSYGAKIFRAEGYVYDSEYIYFEDSYSVEIIISRNNDEAEKPIQTPTEAPAPIPTEAPTQTPAETPTSIPTEAPTQTPTEAPTPIPTEAPTQNPTETPAPIPTEAPTQTPTEAPTPIPTEAPTQTPTETPTQPPVEIEYGKQVGDHARPMDLISYSGEIVNITQTRGKVTVINFWGTWCYWCLVELPYFDQVASEYQDSVSIIAVHSSGDTEGKEYVSQNYPDTKIIFANDPTDRNVYYTELGGVGSYPTTVILDEDGVIAYTHVGAMSYEVLTAKINEILAK